MCDGDQYDSDKILYVPKLYGKIKKTRYMNMKNEKIKGVIYKITNTINGRIYIGQTSDFKNRMRQYRYEANPVRELRFKHPVVIAMREYGIENFAVKILAEYDNEDILSEMEKYYIDKFDAMNPSIGYNVSRGGTTKRKHKGSNFKHTEEEKLRRSKGLLVFYEGSFKRYTSAKVFADEMGCDRAIITRAARIGSSYYDHYVYYEDIDERLKYIELNSRKKRYYMIGKMLNRESVETIESQVYVLLDK